jgi:hypothetical protein
MLENPDRQTAVKRQIIYASPVTVVTVEFWYRGTGTGMYNTFVGIGVATCNSEDVFSKQEGLAIATKRAVRMIADDREARNAAVEYLAWILEVY